MEPEREPGASSTANETSYQAHQNHEDDDEVPLSTISCDRCRRRKVRCDRRHPCSYCVRIDVPCTYPTKQKPKERKQRIFVSELYERKIDFIVKKLEEFGHALGNLEGRPEIATQAAPPYRPSPSTTVSSSSPTPDMLVASSPLSRDASKILTPKLEYEGESSLSAQAAFANRFLRDAVNNKPSIDITGEMASVLDTLSRTIGGQKRDQEPEYLYPYARTLKPGSNLRDLPMPPVQSAFACLRMAKEHIRVRFFWNHEINSISAFTDYFLRVYSPGDSDPAYADLIMVNAGLYWLFLECKNVIADPNKKADCEAQATVCRANLETVLSILPFHLPSTMETTCAMTVAGMYCLDTCKPSAAYNFIATASHMCQTLGMHNIVTMTNDDVQTRTNKLKLFWIIYMQEKGLALRLGRSSTIRDSDVTVPPVSVDSRSEAAVFGQLQKWAGLARLQGMVYDKIYSPNALIQPQAIRTAQARQLALELEQHTNHRSPDEMRYLEALRNAVGDTVYKAFISTTRVTHLSLLCLIYRAIPADPGEGTIFGKECILNARQALEEHQRCMTIIANFEEDFLETYINWAILQSPFVPFTVLFCHIIETGNEDDLKRLGSLIESLQFSSADSFSVGIQKEIRLFKVLYDVACSYINAKKSSSTEPGGTEDWSDSTLMVPPALPQPTVLATPSSTDLSQTPLPHMSDAGNVMGAMFNEQVPVPNWMTGGSFGMPGDTGMEIDHQGAQLGNWLYMNNQMLRALEDSYF
ncbi:fungal specific transcription factor [Colletotrichum truncatum]|uniref:Fungal specific transcription factor n=1 Tax=Colletotrichum truncatum TaxID=5467 RepID=A0ACC3Z056_COLTU